MTHPNPSTALAAVVIDQLVEGGVDTIVISPGSRSAALAIAASANTSIQTVVAIDERSGGFHALGVAKASGVPAAVIATSGTAPANYFPAVVEADMSCVPLFLISADRPEELRGVGANQTIDQVRLFGGKVRAYGGIEAPDGATDANQTWRETVSELLEAATGPKPGPVHLNIAFREPTMPVTDDGRTRASPYQHPTPRLTHQPSGGVGSSPEVPALDATRGLVLAGDGAYDRTALMSAADMLGWPILATALSGLRGTSVVSSYEHLLADGVPDHLRPETVVAIGSLGPGSALGRVVGVADNRVRVDAWGRAIDPDRNATASVTGDPSQVLEAVSGRAEAGWRSSWLEADRGVRSRLDQALRATNQPSGAAIALALDEVAWGALVVASSLPIREVDAHSNRTGPVYANRGASGIDGLVSSALGVASVHPRTLAFSGDLSLLHDSNGFLIDVEVDLAIVVADNGGGGLFDSLPQARHAPDFERLFITDPRRDLADVARLHKLEFHLAPTTAEMVDHASSALASGGRHLIVVPIARSHDLDVRDRLRRLPMP